MSTQQPVPEPTQGGSYVRNADGTLERQQWTEQATVEAHAAAKQEAAKQAAAEAAKQEAAKQAAAEAAAAPQPAPEA